jgi:hypothetical protein
MPTFLARSISLQKWQARTHILDHQIPADGVTYDLRTTGNILSFWACDPTEPASLDEVALALASTRDRVQRVDLVWVDEDEVKRVNVTIQEDKGNTPARHLAEKHRHVVGIDLLRLVRLSRNLAHALKNDQYKRFTLQEIKKLLADAVDKGTISAADLKPEIVEQISQ